MKVKLKKLIAIHLALLMVSTSAYPCTGITLKSADGGVVVSRTVEWALNDANNPHIQPIICGWRVVARNVWSNRRSEVPDWRGKDA